MSCPPDLLLDRARALADRGGRALLGITGAPGAGKSTLAHALGAIAVPPTVPLVITEGNYLLADDPWSAIRPLLDVAWFLRPDESQRRAWLIAQHRRFGGDADQARRHADGSDQHNAELVAPTACRADLIVTE
jgi:pantothenate kinase